MKAYLFLGGGSAILAATSLFLFLAGSRLDLEGASREALIENFVEENSAHREIKVTDLFLSAASEELRDPANTLPRTFIYDPGELNALYQLATFCRGVEKSRINDFRLKKAVVWHRFLCGEFQYLPSNFFEKAPYVHPSGSSYAKLARDSSKEAFQSEAWLESHRRFFHVLELQSPLFPELSLDGWNELYQRADRLVTRDHLWLRAKSFDEFSDSGNYLIYSRASWDRFQRDSAPSEVRTRLAFLIGGISLLLLVSLLILEFSRRRKMRREEVERRLFVLQTLTHELRTPVATFALSVELMKRDLCHLPLSGQKSLYRMEEELKRLRELVEASGRYLVSTNDGDVQIACVKMSLNGAMEQISRHFGESVTVRPLSRDIEIESDPFWLNFCVRNLIENALQHGKPPVVLSAEVDGGTVSLNVSDGGKFVLKQTGGGMGIGLKLVGRVIDQMKGKFSFRESPTTFSINLRIA